VAEGRRTLARTFRQRDGEDACERVRLVPALGGSVGEVGVAEDHDEKEEHEERFQ
jgi:hypothetical protein